MVAKINEENERLKRRYLQHVRYKKGRDSATLDKIADAITQFDRANGHKSLKLFRIEWAMTFADKLEKRTNSKTGKPISKSTADGLMRMLKDFFLWVADQEGYRKQVRYSHAEYFRVSMKAGRIAHADRDAPYPSPEMCRHAFDQMPTATDIERRNKAAFAFLMLTGIRDGALVTVRLKHINLTEGTVYQDARDVKTKFSKTFSTWFFPVDPVYRECFEEWVNHLRKDKLFGSEDALFPRQTIGQVDGVFAVTGLSRECYSNATALRTVIKEAFTNGGLEPFAPHSFRKTLGQLANLHCKTPEQFKAWSMNLGHENIATTLSAYMPVSTARQGELIKAMRAIPA
jgi:integrase/recombinase XerD